MLAKLTGKGGRVGEVVAFEKLLFHFLSIVALGFAVKSKHVSRFFIFT